MVDVYCVNVVMKPFELNIIRYRGRFLLRIAFKFVYAPLGGATRECQNAEFENTVNLFFVS